jgi:hypothetical protein
MKKFKISFLLVLLLSAALPQRAVAQSRPRSRPTSVESSSYDSTLRYDISAGSGRYNDETYSEITAGLNWGFSEWWTWRNALFHRFGTVTDSISGLDTSLRLGNSFVTDGGGLGFNFFAGPGYRFASSDASAVFGEAGFGFKVAGIYLGVGLKSLYYARTRLDSAGNELPKNDNMFFLVLAGGGAL